MKPGETPNPKEPTRTIELPQLSVRAEVERTSFNEEDRTVDLVWSTGAAVKRYDWWNDRYYLELLSLDPKHVRLERLNSGAPLLDTHSGWFLGSQLGVVEDDSAKLSGKKATATVRFSRRAEVEPIIQDVRDKIIRNVSVGYVVHEYEVTPGKRKGDLETRTAIDWEPYEVSLVPMPADPGAQVRSAKAQGGKMPEPLQRFPCRLTMRGAESSPTVVPPAQEPTMTRETSETIAERNPLDPGAPTVQRTEPEAPAAPSDAELAARAERQRVQGIMLACRASRMTQEFQDQLIGEGLSLEQAQTRVFEEMRKRGGETAGPKSSAVRTEPTVQFGEDPMVHVRAGIENALTHRLAGDMRKKDGTLVVPLSDQGRRYRGMSLMDVARAYLQGRGIRVTDMPKTKLAGVALGLVDVRSGGMHTTSDFADLLADVAHKTLRAAYAEAPQTFRPLVRVVTLTDFKPVYRTQLGDAPALLEVGEAGEYKSGTVSDGKTSYQLATYGRKFSISRQALINDDVDAFARVPMMFGRKARVLESNLVWAQITGNPTMSDNNALFSAAHGNLQTDGDHISVESLGRARAALRQQTSLDGDYLNLTGAYLLVPTVLETKADQFVTVVLPQEAGKVNPFQNKLTVIAEPRLDANSTTAWYLAASVDQVDIIELAYLEGEEGPMVESRVGFDVDGLEIKARLDVAAKAIDWRGLHKDPGDLDS